MVIKIGVVASSFEEPKFYLKQNVAGANYIDSVAKAGGLPFIIPITQNIKHLTSYIDLCDGFLFCGGADLNPLTYNENPHPQLGDTDLDFDYFQLKLIQFALSEKKPILGICRGEQLLNVACGGTLYQDLTLAPMQTMKHMQSEIKRYSVSHKVFFSENSILFQLFGKEILTNSYHHQSVKTLGVHLRSTAYSEDKIIEGIERTDHPFQVGVQWHPENFIQVSDAMIPLFQKLVNVSAAMK